MILSITYSRPNNSITHRAALPPQSIARLVYVTTIYSIFFLNLNLIRSRFIFFLQSKYNLIYNPNYNNSNYFRLENKYNIKIYYRIYLYTYPKFKSNPDATIILGRLLVLPPTNLTIQINDYYESSFINIVF